MEKLSNSERGAEEELEANEMTEMKRQKGMTRREFLGLLGSAAVAGVVLKGLEIFDKETDINPERIRTTTAVATRVSASVKARGTDNVVLQFDGHSEFRSFPSGFFKQGESFIIRYVEPNLLEEVMRIKILGIQREGDTDFYKYSF